ncbi:MAG: HD domain-containing protein [Myxococcales bacterium]|nr:MAG: HD domain-containing protein [Myxococcales bacterium]
MILRDPVHGLIAFEGMAERVVRSLLDTREVQRLRRVRQLGLAPLAFPGAEHTRFSHAIGTAHVMQALQHRIDACSGELPPDQRLDDDARAEGLAAALLHDLGHGPFSHLFEEVLPHAKHHEQWTQEILLDPSTEVHQTLESISAGMAERVASLLSGKYRLGYLSQSVSGTLDVDRADYLLRDSHMTGVRYGLYDLDWLLQALTFACVNDRWVLAVQGRKGLPPAESFFLGRHFMYQQVYHHKATRAAEALVRAIFMRVSELISDGAPPDPLLPAFRAAALGESLSLDEYLRMDDAELLTCLGAWEQGGDQTLAQLSKRLRCRELPKTVPLPEIRRDRWSEALARTEEIVADRGLRPDLTVWLDIAEDVPYYEPTDGSADGMWVTLRHQPLQRLGDASFLLGQLRNKRIERPRLIFPAQFRDEVLAALHSVLD